MRIGVCGAGGRMGRAVCKAVEAEPEFELVCAVDPSYAGGDLRDLVDGISTGLEITADISSLEEAKTDAMVDFSVAEAARKSISHALEHGIHCVVGTTGLEQDDLLQFDRIALKREVACLVASNFAIGAVLMMEFAARAGRYLEDCEIVEIHHPAKLDAPSGTSRDTARMILEARGHDSWEETDEGPRGRNIGGINVHSIRLSGMVAHQEVIFGGKGQALTIRHDSFDRTSFMPGVIMGLKRAPRLRGLVLGLHSILDA
jgi:4-hydroxy-tetrahydrodipicolinate reductase